MIAGGDWKIDLAKTLVKGAGDIQNVAADLEKIDSHFAASEKFITQAGTKIPEKNRIDTIKSVTKRYCDILEGYATRHRQTDGDALCAAGIARVADENVPDKCGDDTKAGIVAGHWEDHIDGAEGDNDKCYADHLARVLLAEKRKIEATEPKTPKSDVATAAVNTGLAASATQDATQDAPKPGTTPTPSGPAIPEPSAQSEQAAPEAPTLPKPATPQTTITRAKGVALRSLLAEAKLLDDEESKNSVKTIEDLLKQFKGQEVDAECPPKIGNARPKTITPEQQKMLVELRKKAINTIDNVQSQESLAEIDCLLNLPTKTPAPSDSVSTNLALMLSPKQLNDTENFNYFLTGGLSYAHNLMDQQNIDSAKNEYVPGDRLDLSANLGFTALQMDASSLEILRITTNDIIPGMATSSSLLPNVALVSSHSPKPTGEDSILGSQHASSQGSVSLGMMPARERLNFVPSKTTDGLKLQGAIKDGFTKDEMESLDSPPASNVSRWLIESTAITLLAGTKNGGIDLINGKLADDLGWEVAGIGGIDPYLYISDGWQLHFQLQGQLDYPFVYGIRPGLGLAKKKGKDAPFDWLNTYTRTGADGKANDTLNSTLVLNFGKLVTLSGSYIWTNAGVGFSIDTGVNCAAGTSTTGARSTSCTDQALQTIYQQSGVSTHALSAALAYHTSIGADVGVEWDYSHSTANPHDVDANTITTGSNAVFVTVAIER